LLLTPETSTMPSSMANPTPLACAVCMTDPRLWEKVRPILADRLKEVNGRLESELSHRIFLHLRSDRQKFFDEPRAGWEEVIDRFNETITDIEEMSRCFALSRYPAAVFHSTQIVEAGLLRLGPLIGVEDPKSGWTAVSNSLAEIIKKKPEQRTVFETNNFSFLEQVNGTVMTLRHAWRNKISHVQNRIVLMTGEFSPDVAEEIIMASRAFMRRLATEMP
jgi:hypothetical protein